MEIENKIARSPCRGSKIPWMRITIFFKKNEYIIVFNCLTTFLSRYIFSNASDESLQLF
jgi:hypothetical protein